MNEFMKAALIRALKTICQTAAATIGTALYLDEVNWQLVASASLLAGILSILTSVAAGLPEVQPAEEMTEEEVSSYEEDDEEWTGAEEEAEA